MPVYVYKNLTTGDTFEVQQRITEPALTTHPETGEPVKRLVQPVGIAFKGSGFYVTDSRKSSESASSKAKDESKNADKSDGKSDSKGDSKSESKSESKSDSKADKSQGKSESKVGSGS